eukprot:3125784-Karenia_brevis.AAC.1
MLPRLRWLPGRAWAIIITQVQRKVVAPACPCPLSPKGEAQPEKGDMEAGTEGVGVSSWQGKRN